MNIYGEIATEIVEEEFDYLTGSDYTGQLNSTSGWLASHLGNLNISLHTDFTGESPELGDEESSIFKLLYLQKYYRSKVNDSLRGIDESVSWITLREGDSSITRTNKNEVAKNWRGIYKDISDELKTLTDKYLIYSAAPRQVLEYEG